MKNLYYAWRDLMQQHYCAMNITAYLACRNHAVRLLWMYASDDYENDEW